MGLEYVYIDGVQLGPFEKVLSDIQYLDFVAPKSVHFAEWHNTKTWSSKYCMVFKQFSFNTDLFDKFELVRFILN